MNQIQRNAISKFVPREFLTLMEYNSIMDINLGEMEERKLTITDVRITDFGAYTKNMKSDQIFNYLNQYFGNMCPIVRKHGGFVTKYNANGFVALYSKPKSAIRAASEMKKKLNEVNLPCPISISIHFSDLILGIIGENERMDCAFISNSNKVMSALQSLIQKFQIETITTLSSFNSIKNKHNDISYRVIGNLYFEEEELEQDKSIQVIEIMNSDDKIKQKEKFEHGVRLFMDKSYSEAFVVFDDLYKSNNKDSLILVYKNKCRQMIEQCRGLVSYLHIGEFLHDTCINQEFSKFCASEFSTENITIWNRIEDFRKLATSVLREEADKIYKQYFELQGDSAININDATKQSILVKIQDENTPIDSTLFDKVQKELELLMNDTWNRFKAKPAYIRSIMYSQYAPRALYLNDF
jgi:D-ribose pyranose/furanose isomerase RbsD